MLQEVVRQSQHHRSAAHSTYQGGGVSFLCTKEIKRESERARARTGGRVCLSEQKRDRETEQQREKAYLSQDLRGCLAFEPVGRSQGKAIVILAGIKCSTIEASGLSQSSI